MGGYVRLALLEDDPEQAAALRNWLLEAGHDVHVYGFSRDLMRESGRESFDLLLLDWMLPDMDGDELLRKLRQQRGSDVPVIFVTSRDSEEDIVAVLAAGADDYMVKPVRRFELLSRIDAVIRRSGARSQAAETLERPPFRFVVATRQLFRQDEAIVLTEREFELALFLFRNIGRLVSRGHLLEAVWGKSAEIATRTIDTHVSRVRSKLNLRPELGFRLSSVYNYGYRLEQLPTASA